MANFWDILLHDHILGWLWPLIQFLLGLNVVVFFHELGHFMAARWAGVKVERFALGMGPRLFGYKSKETDYCICLLPLGGYVKMLGQDDFAPREEDDDSVEDDKGEKKLDPRSYNAAPAGKRLVIIAAGVVMNVIIAAIMFVIIAMVGKDYPAAVIGGLRADYPAANSQITWLNGTPPANTPEEKAKVNKLQPGDKIVKVNGKVIPHFQKVMVMAVLADRDEVFNLHIERKDDKGKVYHGKVDVGVKFDGQKLAFGISPEEGMKLAINERDLLATPLKNGDVISSINGKPVEGMWQVNKIQKTLDGKPVEVTFDRSTGVSIEEMKTSLTPILSTRTIFTKAGVKYYSKDLTVKLNKDKEPVSPAVYIYKDKAAEKDIEIPESEIANGGGRAGLDILGLIPRTIVTRVVKHSPAYKAELKPGDIILSYADTPFPTTRRFVELSKGLKGNKTNLLIERDGEQKVISIAAEEEDGRYVVGILQGLDTDTLIVGHVREGSPAAAAGITSDTQITAVNGKPVKNWNELYEAIKSIQGKNEKVTINLDCKVAGATKSIALADITTSQFAASDYRYHIFDTSTVVFEPLAVFIQHSNPLDGLTWGITETGDLIIQTYGSIRSMFNRNVSASAMSGPIGIGHLAVQSARRSFMDLFYLTAIISASLAVFNFLPIPVLDGGHAVLIIAEMIRRKPLPLKVVNTIQYIGLAMIACLFLAVTFNDIMKFFN